MKFESKEDSYILPILLFGIITFLYFVFEDYGFVAIVSFILCLLYANTKEEKVEDIFTKGMYYFFCLIFAIVMIMFFGSLLIAIFN